MSYPATASYPASASYPAAATYPASATYPGVWTPAQIPGLSFYNDGLIGDVFKDTPPTVPCANGDLIATAKALFGTTNNSTATLLLRPTATTTGVQFDDAGVQYLAPVTPIVCDPSVGYTVIYVVYMPGTGSPQLVPFGNLTNAAGSVLLNDNNTASVLDDSGTTLSSATATSPPLNGKILVWLECDAAGNATISNSGSSGAGTGSLPNSITFNQLGTDTGLGVINDNALNNYLLWMKVDNQITTGSALGLQIRGYITTTYGASL